MDPMVEGMVDDEFRETPKTESKANCDAQEGKQEHEPDKKEIRNPGLLLFERPHDLQFSVLVSFLLEAVIKLEEDSDPVDEDDEIVRREVTDKTFITIPSLFKNDVNLSPVDSVEKERSKRRLLWTGMK